MATRDSTTRRVRAGGKAVATSKFQGDKLVLASEPTSEVVPENMSTIRITNDTPSDIRFRFGATVEEAESVSQTDGIKVKASEVEDYMVNHDDKYWAYISLDGDVTIGTLWG